VAAGRLRLALGQCHRRLKRQALAQEGAAEHLMGLAATLHAAGRPESAQCLAGVARHFRVKAICLGARADALHWRKGPFA
jgi:hypothetical protein